MRFLTSDDTPAATTEPVDPARPWDDVPKDAREAERTKRRVRILRRVRLDGRAVPVGEVVRVDHATALSLVRNRQAEPIR